jgi:cell division protein ZapD
MNSYLDPRPDADPELAPVIYEQPLNERMRTFLRLEFLYTQASYHADFPNPWSTRSAVGSLLEILAITARGDSRSEVLKELERHVNVLKEFQSKTGVDPTRLKSLMSNLVKMREDLSTAGGNFMGPTRNS